MTKKHLDMIKEIGRNINEMVGENVKMNVMEGVELLKPGSSKKKVSLWVKDAISRLDQNTTKEEGEQIMELCGKNCAKINKRALEIFNKKVQKFPTIEEFLDAEEKNPSRGTEIKLENQLIHLYYLPQEYNPKYPMRCYCTLVNAIPKDQQMSSTYCHCSKALVKQQWESALKKQIDVEVLETTLTGASTCHFVLRIKK